MNDDTVNEAQCDVFLKAFKAALRAVLQRTAHLNGSPISFQDPDVLALLDTIQHALQHGLLADVHLWNFLEHLEHVSSADSVQKVKQHSARHHLTPDEKVRLWICLSIASGTLSDSLVCMTQQADIQAAYYSPGAFLQSEHHSSALALSLAQLNFLKFAEVLPTPVPNKVETPKAATFARGLSSLREFALEKAAQTQKEISDWAAKVEAEKTELHTLKAAFSKATKEAHAQISDLAMRLQLSEQVRHELCQQLANQAHHWDLVLPKLADIGVTLDIVPNSSLLSALLDEEKVRLQLTVSEMTEVAADEYRRHQEERDALRNEIVALQARCQSLEGELEGAEKSMTDACKHMNTFLVQLAEQENRTKLMDDYQEERQKLKKSFVSAHEAFTQKWTNLGVHCNSCRDPTHCSGVLLEEDPSGDGQTAQLVARLQEQLGLAKQEIQARNEVIEQMISAIEGTPNISLDVQDASTQQDRMAQLLDLAQQAAAQLRREQCRVQQLEREVQMERELNKVNYTSMTAALEKAKAQAKHQATLVAEERQRTQTTARLLEELQLENTTQAKEHAQQLELERKTITELSQKLKHLETEVQGLRSNSGMLETELGSAKARLNFHEKEAATAQAQLQDCRTQLTEKMAAIQVMEERLSDMAAQLEDAHQNAETERSLVEGKLKDLELQHEGLLATLEQRNAEIVYLTNRLDVVQDELDNLKDDPKERKCLLCGADFHLTRRRHHCRSCNRPVCDGCAPLRAQPQLPQFGGKPTRICKNCT